MRTITDGLWAIILLVLGLGCATWFVDLVRWTGNKAIDAHQTGLVSLPELNKKLFDEGKK